MRQHESQLVELFESARQHISNIKPSDWVEKYREMSTDLTAYPGPFRYSRTPYLREIVDCLSPDHPAHTVAVMKGAQLGFSAGVIEGGICWIIDQNPGPILFLSGHEELSEEMMNMRVDRAIDLSGLRHKIRPNALRKKNARTGDTAKSKEFPGGSLIAGSANNHSLLRQRSVRYGFIDDFDAVKKSSKESGSTTSLIEKRFASYGSRRKLFYISTPEQKLTSNIEPAYLLGDQRRFLIPCPCCGDYIPLEWDVAIEGGETKDRGGIHWKTDDHGRVVAGSVGYICQKCGDFFDDRKKLDLLQAGFWKPMAEPSEVGYYSYHISALYAPPGMDDWEKYARDFVKGNPPQGKKDKGLFQTFVNTVQGLTYEEEGEAPEANAVQKNVRDYQVGEVPEELSMVDGNGKIIMLTCSVDLNGVVKDARLDYEITAWSESGASYSVKHGSIGTFKLSSLKKKGEVEDRDLWTYNFNTKNSVWPELTKIIQSDYPRSNGTRPMKIVITGIDCGQYSKYAYPYIDANGPFVVGLKGRDETKFSRFGVDFSPYRPAKERAKLYLIEVNRIKDELAELIKLPWNSEIDAKQPPGFLNFPQPSGGLYGYKNYFAHYEAEHKVPEVKDGVEQGFIWRKKNSAAQNHAWDLKVYNMVLREIFKDMIFKELKIKSGTWQDFVNLMLRKN